MDTASTYGFPLFWYAYVYLSQFEHVLAESIVVELTRSGELGFQRLLGMESTLFNNYPSSCASLLRLCSHSSDLGALSHGDFGPELMSYF